MKIKLDGKTCEMSFWSFFKMHFISWLLLSGILYAGFFIIGILVS